MINPGIRNHRGAEDVHRTQAAKVDPMSKMTCWLELRHKEYSKCKEARVQQRRQEAVLLQISDTKLISHSTPGLPFEDS